MAVDSARCYGTGDEQDAANYSWTTSPEVLACQVLSLLLAVFG